MKLLLLATLVAAALSQPLELTDDDISQWELFKIEFEKEYASDEEEQKRKLIFMDNLNFTREHNSRHRRGEVTFDVAVNHFSDLTVEEFAARMNGYQQAKGVEEGGEPFHEPDNVEVPSTFDWRKKGAVTPVKNQGQCGSCWTFSVTGTVEGQHFLKYKKLVSLSEQNLVDCSKNGGNEGCNGGYMTSAYRYIRKNKGIDTEKSYPYKGKNGKCHYKPQHRGATVSSYVILPHGDEKKLKVAVASKGPISVGIDANLQSFIHYKSGVYKDRKCSSKDKDLDHAVLVIGYGTVKKGGAYWLVKNSWGTSWGMKGYVMMARNRKNMCGIASQATYPIV